ncbi:c-type cytochrome [Bacillus testis]|uniref:c-type cytochrome n=1 Tax=Bacillus testis TaxID=1622072 RepID=UPI00067E9841|nr:c-type cytochrome [Bacillus testis]
MNKNVLYSIVSIAGTIILGFAIMIMFIHVPDGGPSRKTTVSSGENMPIKTKATAASTADIVEAKFKDFMPPSLDDVPAGEKGEQIKHGYKYLSETATTLDGYVGNSLSCTSCHANGGNGPELDLIGITKTYPAYNARAGKEVSIEDRINGCFRRSMNGKPLLKDGSEMKAMVAYLDYISSNVPTGIKERPWAALDKIDGDITQVNTDRGRDIYQKACITCHGENGEGNNNGLAVFGDNSYNIGAGMGRIRTAAAFIKDFMPKAATGGIEPGTLTRQEALDVAAYINAQARPDFLDKIYDWPKGDAPDDAAYETLAQKKK